LKPQPEKTTDETSDIRRLGDEFLAAYNASDLQKICEVLSEGAVLMPPNEPPVNGIEDIRSRFEAFFTGFTFNIRFYPSQTNVVGDLAFERGSYAAYALLKGEAGEPRGGYGEYLLIFERQPNARWKIGAFGTAAAEGTPPRNIAGPVRLTNLIESAQWGETLSERYAKGK
jgi:ketosteroid isomerase-like protein